MDEEQRITSLIAEIESIKIRLAAMESLLSTQKQSSEPEEIHRDKTFNPAKHSTAHDPLYTSNSFPEVKSAKKERAPIFKDNFEMLIGKNLLNRVGIIVLLFAVGYFLKYSFENGWIGELGRVVIGFLAGMSFIIAGDISMRRKYKYFSQGLSGGGIAIIYLSTFAAVNFYHLISSFTAFTILLIATVTGGLLANRQNALGVAVLSTLGGFMAPFLIGSEGGNTIALLAYISLLDLSVLYLAYYKNWRSLNILALAGTVLVYSINSAVSPTPQNEIFWISQCFLVIYFLIFGALSFFYNVRHKKSSSLMDILILISNAAFFFGASYLNLNRYYPDWMGLFAIIMTVCYLSVSLILQRKKLGDRLLFLSLLGTGLAFLTLAIPLQFNQHWIVAAWLVEAGVLIYAGFSAKNKMVLSAGLALLVCVAIPTAVSPPYFAKLPVPLLNYYSLDAILGIGGFILSAYVLYPRSQPSQTGSVLSWAFAITAVLLTLMHLSWEVENALKYFKLSYSLDFSVSLSWIILAVILILWGLMKNNKMFRILALALFAITTTKVMFNDMSYMPMVFRIIILTVVGTILVGVSFAYQRKEKREELL